MARSLTQDFAQEGVLLASTAASVGLNRDCTCLTLDRETLGTSPAIWNAICGPSTGKRCRKRERRSLSVLASGCA